MTVIIKLTGQSLVNYVNDKNELVVKGELTKTDLIKDAGYVYDNGTAMYTEFYTELLSAKGVIPVTNTDVETEAYDDLSGTQQDLYDQVDEMFGEKWSHEEVMEFMNELDEIGIETPEQLGEAYEYTSDSYKAEAEFAEYLVTEVLSTGIPEILEGHIDWQSVWSCELKYDYNTIEFDGETYFFHNY